MGLIDKMIKIFRVAIFLTTFAFFTPAFGGNGDDSPRMKDEDRRSVAVVSGIGDTFHMAYRGITVFEQKDASTPVPDWGVNGQAIKSSISYLNSLERYDASPLEGVFDLKDVRLAQDAAKLAGFDFLVTISSKDQGNPPYLDGPFGIYRKGFMGSHDDCVYSLLVLAVYDVRSGKSFGEKRNTSKFGNLICYGQDGSGVPWNEKTVWKEDLKDYSPELIEVLKINVISNVDETIPMTLKAYGFSEGETPEETFADSQSHRKKRFLFQ